MKLAMTVLMPLLLCFSLISSPVWANADINENETDLYYANGIGMELDRDADQRVWETRVKNTELQHSLLKY